MDKKDICICVGSHDTFRLGFT